MKVFRVAHRRYKSGESYRSGDLILEAYLKPEVIGGILQGLAAMLGAGAVIYAGYVGSNTFEKWRVQKLEERKIEEAEKIVVAAYSARRQLHYIRSPFIAPQESFDAEVQLREGGHELDDDRVRSKRLITAQVYNNRLNASYEKVMALDERMPMARALFGDELEGALEKLGAQFNVIRSFIDAKALYDPVSGDIAFENKMHSALTRGYPNDVDDQIARIVDEQIKTIENLCLPVFRLAVGRVG